MVFVLDSGQFRDQWPDQDAYDSEFDRAEVILGVLVQDVANVSTAAANQDRGVWARSHWYGRSTWRAARYHGNAAEDRSRELSTEGHRWRSLQASLFGADQDRAAQP